MVIQVVKEDCNFGTKAFLVSCYLGQYSFLYGNICSEKQKLPRIFFALTKAKNF